MGQSVTGEEDSYDRDDTNRNIDRQIWRDWLQSGDVEWGQASDPIGIVSDMVAHREGGNPRRIPQPQRTEAGL